MATEVIKRIDPRGYGDYGTLSQWVAARKGDLTVRDTVEIAEVCGGGNVGRLFIHDTDGWVCDATRYPHIRAAQGHGHGGVFDNAEHAYLSNFDAVETDPTSPVFGFPPFTVDIKNVGFVRVGPGLCIQQSQTALALSATVFNVRDLAADGPCTFESLYLRMGNNRDTICAFAFTTTNDTNPHIIKSCVVTSRNQGNQCWRAVFTNGAATKVLVYNNSFEISTNGASQVLQSTLGAITSQNNYLMGYLGGGNYGGAGVVKGANDATHNAEALTVGLRNIPTADAFNSSGGGDFRLRPSVPGGFTNLLIGAGANLLAAGVTRDFMSRTRFVPFDIGAHQLYDNPGNKGSALSV